MDDNVITELARAAEAVINQNHGNAFPGKQWLSAALNEYEAARVHPAARLHPVASERTEELATASDAALPATLDEELQEIRNGWLDSEDDSPALLRAIYDYGRHEERRAAQDAALPAQGTHVEPDALAASVAELEALSLSEDRGLTISEMESMMLVLLELKHRQTAPAPRDAALPVEAVLTLSDIENCLKTADASWISGNGVQFSTEGWEVFTREILSCNGRKECDE